MKSFKSTISIIIASIFILLAFISCPAYIPPSSGSETDPGDVWIEPESETVSEDFETEVHCNTGSQHLAAYGIDFYYDSEKISASSVTAGADGFLSASNINEPGKIATSGFNAGGVTPGTDLHLLTIHWTIVSSGTSNIDVDVDTGTFVNENTEIIGTPMGISGSVTVTARK